MTLKNLLRGGGWIAFGLLISLISVVLMNWLTQIPAELLPQAYRQMSDLLSFGAWIQAFLILLVVLYWRRIVNYGRLKSIVKKHEHRKLIAARNKVIFILAAYWVVFPVGPVRVLNFILSY